MSRLARDAVWEHSKAYGSALTVMLCLAEHSNEGKQHKSWPGIERIAERTRQSPRQVKRHLKALQELGELHVDPQAGRSKQNEYWILLPGLPTPPGLPKRSLAPDAGSAGEGLRKGLARASKCLADANKGLAGDIQGKEGVTSEAEAPAADDTQTFSGAKKMNQEDPLTPPEGEEMDCDAVFWIEGIATLFHQEASSIPPRLVRLLRKKGMPPREEFAVLKRYIKAGDPEPWDQEEEAQLLRCRKRKVSTVIRNLEEMVGNAKRYARLLPLAPRMPTTVPSEPVWEWRAFLIDRYCDPEPVNLTGKVITERDREEAKQNADEMRERITKWTWIDLPAYLLTEIGEEGLRRRAEATATEDSVETTA